MPAKCSSVAVQFINHDIIQIGKYKIKSIFTVVGQESCIQHLRIRQNNIRTLPDPAAFCRHRISIIDPCRYAPLQNTPVQEPIPDTDHLQVLSSDKSKSRVSGFSKICCNTGSKKLKVLPLAVAVVMTRLFSLHRPLRTSPPDDCKAGKSPLRSEIIANLRSP